MPDSIPNEPTPGGDWHKYVAGGRDRAGREIEKVYALDDAYVIYFSDCELFYETVPRQVKDLGPYDAFLARINRVLPDNPSDKNDPVYKDKFSTLELVADAFEMVFNGESSDALEILQAIYDKLETIEKGKRQLYYQVGAFSITFVAWCLYLMMSASNSWPAAWKPWALASVLAMGGGVFSVCLTIATLEVSLNQKFSFLWSSGATRSFIALLAGVAILLAMRAKIFGGITYSGTLPNAGDSLTIGEMFFCFVAGFSESFVPNILRNASSQTGGDPTKTDSNQNNGNRGGQPTDKLSDTPEEPVNTKAAAVPLIVPNINTPPAGKQPGPALPSGNQQGGQAGGS